MREDPAGEPDDVDAAADLALRIAGSRLLQSTRGAFDQIASGFYGVGSNALTVLIGVLLPEPERPQTNPRRSAQHATPASK